MSPGFPKLRHFIHETSGIEQFLFNGVVTLGSYELEIVGWMGWRGGGKRIVSRDCTDDDAIVLPKRDEGPIIPCVNHESDQPTIDNLQ